MRLPALAAAVSALTLAAACGANGQDEPAAAQNNGGAGGPLETRPANGASQQPAFTGQTRAPACVYRHASSPADKPVPAGTRVTVRQLGLGSSAG